jgi:hypothetical protein
MKMKSLLAAVLLATTTLSAVAEEHKTALSANAGTQVVTCSGRLVAGTKAYLGILDCGVPKDEVNFSLDLSNIPAANRDWIGKVCGLPREKGMPGAFCHIQAHVKDHPTLDDGFLALEVLHVTNKPKFSWEKEPGC